MEELWRKPNTFADLLKLNVDYIKGKHEMTPYHHGPLDPETDELIPGLLQLHGLGIFTTDSQPFMSTVAEDKDSGEYFELRQRPYLNIVLADADQPMRLWNSLKQRKDIKVYGFKLYSSEMSEYKRLDGTRMKTRVVTKDRWAKSRKELQITPWTVYSTMYLLSGTEHEDLFTEYEVWKMVKPWSITVVGASWKEPTDLVKIIAEAASSATS